MKNIRDKDLECLMGILKHLRETIDKLYLISDILLDFKKNENLCSAISTMADKSENMHSVLTNIIYRANQPQTGEQDGDPNPTN